MLASGGSVGDHGGGFRPRRPHLLERIMLRATIPQFRCVLGILGLAIAACAPAAARGDIAYFVSMTTGGLYSFDTSNPGAGISTQAPAGTFSSPSALAFGPDGNLYVGDGNGGGRVARYIVSTGSVATVASLATAGPVGPGAIAFRPSAQGGEMLVGRNPYTAFYSYPTGSVLKVSGWGAGQTAAVQNYTSGASLDYSPGLAVAADGSLYVSNSYYNLLTYEMTGNVLKFDASGAFQSEVAADKHASYGLYGPSGLALAGNSLFIASTMNGTIYKTNLLDPNTATNTSFFAMTPVDPVSFYPDFIGPLAALSDGGLLTAGVANSGLMYRFDSSGSLVGSVGGSSYGQIGGIAIAPVPEPAAAAMAAAGAAALAVTRLRWRWRAE